MVGERVEGEIMTNYAGLKAVIYHRKSSLENKEETDKKIEACYTWGVNVGHYVLGPKPVVVYLDTTDRPADQANLTRLLQDAKDKKFHIVICYSMLTLSNCVWPNMVALLTSLTTNVSIKFVSWNAVDANQMISMLGEWEQQKASQRQLVIAAKGMPCGRPKVYIDVEEAIRLRKEEMLTFKEIGERLKASVAMVYREMPKELRGVIPKDVRRRAGEQIRIEKRRKETN